jgi:hypothetical protein
MTKQKKTEIVNLIQKEIGGGKISKKQIDDSNLSKGKVIISGLNQDTFEYLIQHYGNNLIELELFKCPRIEDYTPLEACPNIETITIFWNQKAKNFWNCEPNKRLKSLIINDCIHIHTLDLIAKSKSLINLSFGNTVWPKTKLNTLSPLKNMKSLESLTLTLNKIVDRSIEPISKIVNLKKLNFPSNLFSTEQVAWLKAHLKTNIESKVLSFGFPFQYSINDKIYTKFRIVGKRKPVLDNTEINHIKQYEDDFNEYFIKYKNNPKIPEPI